SLPSAEQALLAPYEALRRSDLLPRLGGETRTREAELVQRAASLRAAGLSDSAALSQLARLEEDLKRGPELFPAGQLDADLQQIDLRARNSWRLSLSEV